MSSCVECGAAADAGLVLECGRRLCGGCVIRLCDVGAVRCRCERLHNIAEDVLRLARSRSLGRWAYRSLSGRKWFLFPARIAAVVEEAFQNNVPTVTIHIPRGEDVVFNLREMVVEHPRPRLISRVCTLTRKETRKIEGEVVVEIESRLHVF